MPEICLYRISHEIYTVWMRIDPDRWVMAVVEGNHFMKRLGAAYEANKIAGLVVENISKAPDCLRIVETESGKYWREAGITGRSKVTYIKMTDTTYSDLSVNMSEDMKKALAEAMAGKLVGE